MKHKHIINSLPLLASILGRKYGVQVRIGGNDAYTDGKTIQLPALPLNADDTLLGLARGLIDHESAHIRDTDFNVLKAANLTPLEKHIWNTLEDRRAENRLTAIYPGCRDNFDWLIKHLFLPKPAKKISQSPADPSLRILDWLLITARSWDVPELVPHRDALRAGVEIHYPGLTHEVEPILRGARANCVTTNDAVNYARQITAALKKYAHFLEQNQNQQPGDQGQGSGIPMAGGSSDTQMDPTRSLQSLQNLLVAGEDSLPGNVGDHLRTILTDACGQAQSRLRIAVPTSKDLRPLQSHELAGSREATTALRTRLQALMQSTRAVRNRTGFSGKLDTRKIHRLSLGDARVFLRKGKRVSVNTAAHILLDSSGSMSGSQMELASQACFAVASALHGIKGVSLGVTAFPGKRFRDPGNQHTQEQTVAPILRHNEKLHSRFGMDGGGGTPLDAALWWALLQMIPMVEPRKIILVITDGQPDDKHLAKEAVKNAFRLSFEVYGIGIGTDSIRDILTEGNCRVISTIRELAPAMFAMLHKALV